MLAHTDPGKYSLDRNYRDDLKWYIELADRSLCWLQHYRDGVEYIATGAFIDLENPGISASSLKSKYARQLQEGPKDE